MSDLQFSIITICYNAGGALRRTIESVNAQTYPNLEHIIIDGGSTDGSVALIKELARRHVRWVSEPDGGIAAAFNKGTGYAKSDYVCYLNAGDVFAAPEVLQRAADCILAAAAGPPTVYYGDYISISGNIPRLQRTSAAAADFAWANPLNHQSSLIPVSLARQHAYDDRLQLGMDYDFWLRVMKETRFAKLDFPVAVFALDGRSSDPAWAVHNLVVRRVLWHINQGTRLGLADIFQLGCRAVILRLRFGLKRLIGPHLAHFVRRAKTRPITPAASLPPKPDLKMAEGMPPSPT